MDRFRFEFFQFQDEVPKKRKFWVNCLVFLSSDDVINSILLDKIDKNVYTNFCQTTCVIVTLFLFNLELSSYNKFNLELLRDKISLQDRKQIRKIHFTTLNGLQKSDVQIPKNFKTKKRIA